MKKLLMVTAGVALLHYLKPVERVPMVGKWAAEVETAAGAAMAYGILVKKVDNQYLQALAEAMIIDGAVKLVDKYVPKVI